MATKMITNKYYFSVEGETEKWYLDWLENAINTNPNAQCKVQFVCTVEKNPIKYVKRLSNITKTTVTHVFDFEEPNNNSFVQSKLTEMRKAEEMGKGIRYELGYSNLMFELWIVLHKADCSGIITDKNQYLRKINSAYGTHFESLAQYKEKNNFATILSKLSLADVIAAIDRAKILMGRKDANGEVKFTYRKYEYYLNNPALSIWKKVETVLKECGVLC